MSASFFARTIPTSVRTTVLRDWLIPAITTELAQGQWVLHLSASITFACPRHVLRVMHVTMSWQARKGKGHACICVRGKKGGRATVGVPHVPCRHDVMASCAVVATLGAGTDFGFRVKSYPPDVGGMIWQLLLVSTGSPSSPQLLYSTRWKTDNASCPAAAPAVPAARAGGGGCPPAPSERGITF